MSLTDQLIEETNDDLLDQAKLEGMQEGIAVLGFSEEDGSLVVVTSMDPQELVYMLDRAKYLIHDGMMDLVDSDHDDYDDFEDDDLSEDRVMN